MKSLRLGLSRRKLCAMPAVLLVVLVVLDLLNSHGAGVSGEAVVVPLVAAGFLSARWTAGYGAAAVALAAASGIGDHSYDAAGLTAQVERLAIVVVGAVVATAIAAARSRRERRLRSMTSIAEAAQQALLPRPPDKLAGLRLAAGYLAAASDAHIGGDFYEVRRTPWGIRLLVGDVRGKGLAAVRMAGVVMAAFRERADERCDLADLVADLDRAVRRESDDSEEFVTALAAEIDPEGRCLRLLLAGHPPPLLVRHGAVVEIEAAETGPPLGLGTAAPPGRVVATELVRGDRLLFYTDGTTEARSADGKFFPLPDRVPEILASGPLREATDAMLAAVAEWTSDALHDDAALLVVEVVGCLAAASPGPE